MYSFYRKLLTQVVSTFFEYLCMAENIIQEYKTKFKVSGPASNDNQLSTKPDK